MKAMMQLEEMTEIDCNENIKAMQWDQPWKNQKDYRICSGFGMNAWVQ